MILTLVTRSIAARAVAAIALVLGGYVLVHERFASFDAAIARVVLAGLGFDIEEGRPGSLTVSVGTDFNVYAVVTGSCSSAAGVLGILAVSVVLLPGRPWRRLLGGALAAALFVAFNVGRICSIVVLGWWLASVSGVVALATLSTLTLVGLAVVAVPHRHLLLRVAALLVSGLCGVLAYDVWTNGDYLNGMSSYHALAGPVLTFGALALGIVLLWRVIAGADPGRSSAHV